MSFSEPTAEPRRTGARRAGGPGRPPADRDLMIRRAIALAGGLILLVLLVLLTRGCLDARQERSYRDYVRDMSDLVQQSGQLSSGLFGVLRDPGDAGPVDVQNSVNGLRVQAEQLVERARDLDPPDEMEAAHGYLIEALEFRRDGLAQIARQLPTALGDDNREDAARRIAGAMQNFLVSDALYSQRVVPDVVAALRKEELAAEVQVPRSQFLPAIDWLQTETVTDRLDRVRGAGGDEQTDGPRGTGLGAVTVGDQTLTAGSPAQITAAPGLAFGVEVQNQGEAVEENVDVTVTLTGGGGEPIKVSQTIDQLPAGESETVNLPLPDTPPTGQPVTVEVAVEPVEGEQVTDNNEASYTAVFSDG